MNRNDRPLRGTDEQRFSGETLQASASAPEKKARHASTLDKFHPECEEVTPNFKCKSDGDSPKSANGLLTLLAEQSPQSEWAPDPNMILFYDGHFGAPGSEEFRTLRSRLDLVRERQSLQTLLITSPMPGEGKTFVAANLSQIIAWQRERHVLLIDGDLRSSHLHHAFGVPAAPGLADYLNGNVDEFAIVKRGRLNNFFFVPGGTPVPNASELIANGRLRVLVKRLASAFDCVIIDSPPVIPVADARLMAEFCDGVLLVLHTGATRSDLAQLAYREFRGRPFVAVVLNRVDRRLIYRYEYRSHPYDSGKHNQPLEAD